MKDWYILSQVNDATNEVFEKMEKCIKDFHVESEKIKDKSSSKDSLEDKDELDEEFVNLQEQETLIIEETHETNTITESKRA